MAIDSTERSALFKRFRHLLGAPMIQVEIPDEILCSVLEIAIEDYAEIVQNYLIENQWQSLFGKDISTTDFAFALSVRSLDFVNQQTWAYSKIVGLQSNGPWELKKDHIHIEDGRQVYVIPAGREVNEVLWFTPSSMNQAIFANFAGGTDAAFNGFAQAGFTGGFGGNQGRQGYYIMPAFDTLLAAADINLKNRMLRSDLVYKITAGPDGTRLLHLLSTPGSKLTFGSSTLGNRLSMVGCDVWYTYYDTTNKNVDQCRKDNPNIIKLPNDVPLGKLDYATFNEPTKVLIRQLFFAEAKRTLGRIRGKFGGFATAKETIVSMDFESLLAEGNEEKEATLTKLNERLEKLSVTAQLQRSATEAELLNKTLQFIPLQIKMI